MKGGEVGKEMLSIRLEIGKKEKCLLIGVRGCGVVVYWMFRLENGVFSIVGRKRIGKEEKFGFFGRRGEFDFT